MGTAVRILVAAALAALVMREVARDAVLRDRLARRLEYARTMRDRLVAEEMQA